MFTYEAFLYFWRWNISGALEYEADLSVIIFENENDPAGICHSQRAAQHGKRQRG